MKKIFLLLSIISSQTLFAQKRQPVDYVNLFTGTSNSRWMLFPGATLPFGMVKLSPDNQENVWNGGYEYTIGSISGFSHLHAMSLSGLSVMPMTGKVELYPGQPKTFMGNANGPFGTMWTAGYHSRYEKSTEKASPGYYSVHLLDHNGVHQKVWGNHAASLISSDSLNDFIALNLGYFFLNSLSQSLFNTLVLA